MISRRPSFLEWVVIAAVVAVVGALLLPDSTTRTRWSLEKRVADFKPAATPTPKDASIVAKDVDVAGRWECKLHLASSSFDFANRPDGGLDVEFSTGGCLGGLELQRTASVRDGVVQLSGPVAEYIPRTYDSLFVLRINTAEYLLPSVLLREFEEEFAAGSDRWRRLVFQRAQSNR